MFFIVRKNLTYKQKKNTYMKKKEKKEHFNYVSKGMLKLIKSNIDFKTGCVLVTNSHFFSLTFRIQYHRIRFYYVKIE